MASFHVNVHGRGDLAQVREALAGIGYAPVAGGTTIGTGAREISPTGSVVAVAVQTDSKAQAVAIVEKDIEGLPELRVGDADEAPDSEV